jgi:hypothetical protein
MMAAYKPFHLFIECDVAGARDAIGPSRAEKGRGMRFG